jgi:hypothetical protein
LRKKLTDKIRNAILKIEAGIKNLQRALEEKKSTNSKTCSKQ